MQKAVAGAAVATDGRGRAGSVARARLSGRVQGVGDRPRGFHIGVALEDPANDASLALNDDQRALSAEIVAKATTSTAGAGLHPRHQAAAGVLAQFGQEQRVHRAVEADMELGYPALGQGLQRNTVELQTLQNVRDSFVVPR